MSKRNSIVLHNYPYNKDFAFTITIDDLHPESDQDREKLDFGSSTKKRPLSIIAETIKIIPDIKFTLFTVPRWMDRSDTPSGWVFPLRKLWRKRRRYYHDEFDISQKKFGKWVKEINSFHPKNIEIAPHGLFHHSQNKKYFRSQEFGGFSKEEIEEKLDQSEKVFTKSKLRHSMGFRPPGWMMPKFMVSILKKRGYLYSAGNSDMISRISLGTTAKGAGLKGQLLIEPTKNDGLYNFTANCYPHQTQRAVEIAKCKGILMVHCHIAATEFGIKAVTRKYSKQLTNILQEIHYQTGQEPWFATLEELAKFFIAKNSLVYKKYSNKIVFYNKSQYPLRGLTFELDGQTHIIKYIPAKSKFEFTLKKASAKTLRQAQGQKVSIVLTVYNGAKTIEKSLASLVNQSYSNTEIIIVNDGSTDATEKIVKQFIKHTKNKKIKLIHQKNKGRAAAKNVGLKKATGEYIAFTEDDAIYSKDYILSAIKHFTNPKTLGIIGPHFVWNKNESITTKAKDLERRRNFLHYKPFSAWIYSKSDLEKISGFNENLEFGEDVEPIKRLKKIFPRRKVVYEPKSIWFHKEPSKFFDYLKRKWKGGMGMAFLHKTHTAVLSPKQKLGVFVFPFLLGCIFIVTLIVLDRLKLRFTAYFLGSIVFLFILLAVRRNDIKKSRLISSENLSIILISLLIEYIWWVVTLIGLYAGFILPESYIKRLLRGR